MSTLSPRAHALPALVTEEEEEVVVAMALVEVSVADALSLVAESSEDVEGVGEGASVLVLPSVLVVVLSVSVLALPVSEVVSADVVGSGVDVLVSTWMSFLGVYASVALALALPVSVSASVLVEKVGVGALVAGIELDFTLQRFDLFDLFRAAIALCDMRRPL